jgi:O6-methylguanine-DNA--protein-cysteine methyltransferase
LLPPNPLALSPFDSHLLLPAGETRTYGDVAGNVDSAAVAAVSILTAVIRSR